MNTTPQNPTPADTPSDEEITVDLELIGDLATAVGADGFSRMASRVLVLLLAYGGDRGFTQQELTRLLEASLPSVSTAVRQLVELDFVRRVSRPISRADYYVTHDNGWTAGLVNLERRYLRTASAFKRGADEMPEGSPGRERLMRSGDFHVRLAGALRGLSEQLIADRLA